MLPTNFHTSIKASEHEEGPSEASLNKKRKIKPPNILKINIRPEMQVLSKENFSLLLTPQKICPTPDLEKYINTERNGNFSLHNDKDGSTFFQFPTSGLKVKFKENTLVNGEQGKVHPVVAITPNNTRSYPMVEKTGEGVVRREVVLLLAIKGNENKAFPYHLIQRIQYSKTDGSSTSYYSRHEKGGDLQQHQAYIQKQYHGKNDGALSYLFNVMSQLVEALSALHHGKFTDGEGKIHSGILHNDLKPANIFVKRNGDVVVADFGCAYFADEPAPQYGTLHCTAPELFLPSAGFCEKGLKNAAKADLWSLGLVFSLLLQGELPEKSTGSGYVLFLPNKFPDMLEILLKFGTWANAYESSAQCEKAREAKKRLEALERKVSIPANATTQAEILMNLSLMMQLPVLERPSSKELKEQLCRLAPCFGTAEVRAEQTKAFVATLVSSTLEEKTNPAVAMLENETKRFVR